LFTSDRAGLYAAASVPVDDRISISKLLQAKTILP
jgi:hypothetical protein